MSGTALTTRVAGISAGFPSEIDSTVKIRWVAPMLTNMSERSVDLLKYIGGPEQFTFNNTTIEWVEDDPYNRRLTHTGLAAGTTTSLVVTAQAQRYPVGTILYNGTITNGEYARVLAVPDVNTLTLQRDITAIGAPGAWASTDEVLVAAFAMQENDDYVYRATSIFSLPFNNPQIYQAGVQATFRRMETALYGLKGSDLDMQATNLVAEQFVAIEQSAVHGARFAGTAAIPSMSGGLKFYITSANGARVTAFAGAAFTRADIDNDLQSLFYAVGGDKMGKTIITGAWGKRKITSFYSAGERMPPAYSGEAGVVVDRLNTDFGPVDVLLHTALAKNEYYIIRKEQMQIGHHGTLGRPQLRALSPSQTGPRVQKVFYADLSMIVAGPQAMARSHHFATTS